MRYPGQLWSSGGYKYGPPSPELYSLLSATQLLPSVNRAHQHQQTMTFYRDFCDDGCYSQFGYDDLYGFRFGRPFSYSLDQFRYGSPYGYRGFGSLFGNRGFLGYGGYYGYGDLSGLGYGYGSGYGYPFSRFGGRFF
ncbi:keratin-associated protein 19-2-like [Manacus vitellinus]|uniref:keratin-associated protein 19-2-like n=1 Tax=Manacus vitellinus TaxID=328815 RepID=UPI0008470A55|nr:keratin-associated protein 19-2-like [Manacus vitellinus]